jgi:Domain of unknown function (DUF4375)
MRRRVNAADAEAQPFLVWNAFVDLLACEEYSALDPSQRPAHLAFWYESEVQNGGHDQYFGNHGTERAGETAAALRGLGLGSQAALLEQASAALETPDYIQRLGEVDAAFDGCRPSISDALRAHLAEAPDRYVEFV